MIPDINLIPKEQEVEQKKGNFANVFLLLLVLAIIIFYAINYFLVHRDVQDIQYKSDQLAAQIQMQDDELALLQGTPQAKLTDSVNFVSGHNTPVANIVDVASKYITGSGELAGLDYTDKNVVFTIYFDNLNEASTYVRNLSNEAIFETVDLKSAAAFTAVDVDNVEDEQDLEGMAQYKAIVSATINEAELKAGGEK